MIETAVNPPLDPAQIQQALAARTADVDRVVSAAFAGQIAAKYPSGLTLLAVGGYGRRELFPHSDVDLLFLVDTEKNIPERGVLSPMLQHLWDSSLRPSHSVHPLIDCTMEHADNGEFTISLLDHRFLAGDAALYTELSQKFSQFRSRSSFSPWNRPQSKSTRTPLCSSRYLEPVTVRAAPRNVR